MHILLYHHVCVPYKAPGSRSCSPPPSVLNIIWYRKGTQWNFNEIIVMTHIHIYLLIHMIIVQSLSHVQLFGPHGLHHTRLPCPSLSPWVCSNSCPLSWWCHPTISSSVAPFYSSPQSFQHQSFPISWLFASSSQSIGASASFLPMNIQRLTGLIFLLSKGLSSVFSSTTVWKCQFFGAQPSLWFNSHIHITICREQDYHWSINYDNFWKRIIIK